MADKKTEEEVAEKALSRINQMKQAAGDFRKNVADLVKDMRVETKDWHFNVESHEEGITVDVAVKLLIATKK